MTEDIKYNKDGSIAKKRGRKPKIAVLPEEIQKVVDDIEKKQHEEFQLMVEEEKLKRSIEQEWDIKLDDEVLFFDPNLSYELTGYKPINKTKGLDFNPNWFTESRETFKKTGHYTLFRSGSKAYADFWTNEYIRCRDGMTVNGYTITGDHYFFLNYYLLMNTTKTVKSASGRSMDFPNFSVAQYEYLHYIELAKRTRMHACLMKARGLGFSEMNASIVDNLYSTRSKSRAIVAAHTSGKLGPTLEKIWGELSFLNDNTDGGFFKLRQVLDKADLKRASYYKYINGQKVEDGWMSQINGVVADTPDKIRGERVDMLIYEEAGSWGGLRKAFIQGEALVNILGDRFGLKIAGGTGGDSGSELEGLRDMYYNPQDYDILPFKHSFTPDHSTVLTGYFLPAFSLVLKPGYMDERGWCDPDKCREYHQQARNKLAGNPKALLDYCAEYCFTAEEAFALEGENKFNKVIIADQLTLIRALKRCPKIETGYFTFNYKSGSPHKVEGGNIANVIWHEDKGGKVKILEHPQWALPELRDEETHEVIREKIEITNALYVAGVDGIDIGMAQTSDETKDPSDFCMVILRRVYGMQDPLIVAIYKDRPLDLREAYHTAIALAMYYNCIINIEATRMSFVNWAKALKLLLYFMKRPRATYPDINKIKSTLYGSPATKMVIEHQTDLIRDFVEDYGYTIWFEEILDELNRYSDEAKTKFDIVAALGMTFLADEELTGIVPKAIKDNTMEKGFLGYYTDENGHKQFGVIPDKKKSTLTFNSDYYEDDSRTIRTSNPRIFYGSLW